MTSGNACNQTHPPYAKIGSYGLYVRAEVIQIGLA